MPYRRSIVSFVDILGFGEIIRSQTADQIEPVISSLKNIALGDTVSGTVPAGLAGSIAFSDSIVRVCPVDTVDRTGALFYELSSLTYALTAAVGNGIFLRGGITIGDVHFDLDSQIVFGPAMVRAYEIESQLAVFPRIVVDPDLIAAHRSEPALQGSAHDLESDLEYVFQFLRRSEDNLYFVDYLTSARRDIEEMQYSYSEFIERHRHNVVSGARDTSSFTRAKQKYFWLANYHNAVVHEQFEGALDELLIGIDDLGA